MLCCFRVLSHLVRLPGPNLSSIAPPPPPPSACPHWTAFILFYLGPNRGSFASSSQQLFTPLLSNDGQEKAKCITLLSALLYIYVFEPFVLFTKHWYITALTSVLRMYSKCSKERWMRTEMRHAALCLQRVSHRKVSETHTNTHFYQIIRH